MKINICFASDNNYVKPLTCAIVSILKNINNEDNICFYILDDDISLPEKEKILSLQGIKNCEIYFVKINKDIFSSLPEIKTWSYISKTTYFRFLIPDLLKDVDKVLYLDCDLIVTFDISELFKYDVEQYYIGAVEDIGYFSNKKIFKMIKIFDVYINTGVLLINLKRWRQDNISLKLFDAVEKKADSLIFADQDAINLVCENKIRFLDISYNLQGACFEINNLLYHPRKKEIKKAIKCHKIIHYTKKSKPWNSYVPLIKYYLKYENMSPFKVRYNLKFKLKIFTGFLKYTMVSGWYILRFIISPLICGYKQDKYVKVKLFNSFTFNLYKYE